MQPFDLIPKLENAAVLDKQVATARKVWSAVLRPQALRDALHGVWLGHALHPMLVQVPVGTWTSAAVLDALPGNERASAVLVGTGLLASTPAVLAGWNDWLDGHEQQQRVGLVHAGVNVVAAGLYAASLVDRLAGRTRRGKALGYAGAAAVSLGGLLGAHMSYRQALGVNHVEDVPHLIPQGWHGVGTVEEIPEGQLIRREVNNVGVLLVRQGERVQAIADACSHLAASLSEGQLQDGCVVCPWHRSTFRLADGGVVHGPATSPQPAFQTRVLAGRVEVRLPGAG